MNEDFKAHLIEALNKGTRFDGRKLTDYRKIEFKQGFIKTGEGSASVKFGDTEVIAGVKMSIEKPYPDTPDEGTIMVEAELLPLSSPDYEPGPPGIKSVEMARVIDRGIRESKALDLKSLCIDKGEKVWSLAIDMLSVNDAGGLLDAFGFAALLAVRDAKFPQAEKGVVDYKHKSDKSVVLTKLPIPVTIYKIGNNMIVDPTIEEESAVDARLTVTSTDDGKLCAMQKGGEGELSAEEIDQMVGIAIEKAKELRALLK